jgi:hypothetical protein
MDYSSLLLLDSLLRYFNVQTPENITFQEGLSFLKKALQQQKKFSHEELDFLKESLPPRKHPLFYKNLKLSL